MPGSGNDVSRGPLVQRLMATFLEELEAHVRTLSRGLVTLQPTTSQIVRSDLIDSLLRATHSLKGAAQSVRVEPLSRGCHLAEEILIGLRRAPGGAQTDADRVSLLLETTDAFAEAGSRLRDGGDLEGAKIMNLLPRLEKVAAELKDARDAHTPAAARPSEPLFSRPSTDREPPIAETREAASRVTITGDRETFGDLASDLAGTIKEHAEAVDKRVDVVLSGASLTLAEEICAGLREPLRHLARNAVDHGIESPAERQYLGKPRRGRIEISASLEGSDLEVSVADDGRGLNLGRLSEEARRLGLAVPAEDSGIIELAFEPGLSTSPIVTKRFGRGIGLDAVKAAAVALGGSVDVQSRVGRGARFTVRVPMPMPMPRVRVLVVRSGGQPFALDATSEQVVEIPDQEVRWVLGRPTYLLEGTRVPVALLSSMLDLEPSARPGTSARAGPQPGSSQSAARSAVLLHGEEGPCLLAVDAVDGDRLLPVTRFGSRFRHFRLFAGAVTLENGELALLLATEGLSRSAIEGPGEGAQEPRFSGRRALLIEESADARSRIEPILRSTGFDVVTALDDDEAVALLRQTRVDLVVLSAATRPADPAGLVASLESSESSRRLPVVLLAHSDDPAFSRQVADHGVSALIRLSDFDQTRFVETIQRLMHLDAASRGERNP